MAVVFKYDVFISYRRQGGAESAALVRNELLHRGIKSSRIFMDTNSLSSGNYLECISTAISTSRNMIVVITEGCFEGLTDESNWIKEIHNALSSGLNIVPIYFDGIHKIEPNSLPASISSLSFENAVLYIHEYSDACFDRLAGRLEKESRAMPKWVKWSAAIVAASGLFWGTHAVIESSRALEPGQVYVLNSASSKCYHRDKKCITLKNSKHKLKIVSIEEAEDMGKRPCKRCCE